MKMKLCWNNIDDIKLTSSGDLGEYWGVPAYRMLKYKLEYVEGCLNCGSDFMRKIGSNGKFCNKECSHEKSLVNLFEKRARAYVKSSNLKQVRRAKFKKNLNKDIIKSDKMPYNSTPAGIKLCKQTREYPHGSNILQLKCDNYNCAKWYTPNYWRAKTLNGYICGYAEGNPMTYCSDECYKSCRGTKDIPQIIAEDLIHVGHYVEAIKIRVKYNKRKPTPLKINCALSKVYPRIKKPKSKPRPKRVYTNVIKNKLNRQLLNEANKAYWNRIAKVRRPTKVKHFNIDSSLSKNGYARERYKILKREEPKLFILKKLLYYSRTRAKQKKFDNDLTLEWLENQIKNECPKTGCDFEFDPDKTRNIYSPSIDRIDNSKGYIQENCQVVIWGYNCAKGPYTDEQLYKVLKTLLDK